MGRQYANLGSHLPAEEWNRSLEPPRCGLCAAAHWLALARTNKAQAQPLLAKAAAQLQELRRMLPATARLEQAPRAQRAACSLEDEVS
jgi:hypothetical protein